MHVSTKNIYLINEHTGKIHIQTEGRPKCMTQIQATRGNFRVLSPQKAKNYPPRAMCRNCDRHLVKVTRSKP